MGVFRTDDGGEYWHDMTQGLPSFHGFPIGVSRNGDGAAYVVPLTFEADNFRVVTASSRSTGRATAAPHGHG